jgi:hypothetical protein
VARSLPLPRRPAVRTEALVRLLPLASLVLGALLLVVAEFLTLREIRTLTVVPAGGRTTAGSHHAYALALIGVALLPMAFGAAVRGARPAAIACLVLSAAAVFVVLGIDRPSLDETGLIGRTYDLAQARAGAGFYVESLGAALAFVGAVATLVLGARAAEPRRAPRRPARDAAPAD